MQFVMKIGEAIVLPNIGNVIVGRNEEITKYDSSKLCRLGESIVIKNDTEEMTFTVTDIRLSYSITDSVIIGLTLEQNENFVKIKPGDSVYKFGNS